MRIGLLKADDVNPDLIIHHGDLGDMFQRFLWDVMDVRLEVFNIRQDQFPASEKAHDAYLISGSRYSVNDSDTWVGRLLTFIQAAEHETPVVGFCFGHQAIARAKGGRVGSLCVPNIGARPVEMVQSPAWAHPWDEAPCVLFNHGEYVAELPEGATLIARDATCPYQIVQFGPRLLGIQAHPEYSVSYQDALMALNPRVTPQMLSEARARTKSTSLSPRLLGLWVRNFIIAARACSSAKGLV
jgi:GMP synthase-like glutamine amidotransferase